MSESRRLAIKEFVIRTVVVNSQSLDLKPSCQLRMEEERFLLRRMQTSTLLLRWRDDEEQRVRCGLSQ